MSVLCFSDIHGQRTLFNQIMSAIGSNDTAYFLGDAIDRGPDGWAILKEIINDPRITFIKGNHEDMMCKALAGFPNYDDNLHDMTVWGWNGNYPTMEAILKDDPQIVAQILEHIQNAPLWATYTNNKGEVFIMSHAGFDYVENPNIIPEEEILWDRSHYISNYWFHDNPDNVTIVHGHTPTILLAEDLAQFHSNIPEEIEPGAYWYANGHKVCIDCGAHFTNITTLLNLDTLDEEVFMIDKN